MTRAEIVERLRHEAAWYDEDDESKALFNAAARIVERWGDARVCAEDVLHNPGCGVVGCTCGFGQVENSARRVLEVDCGK